MNNELGYCERHQCAFEIKRIPGSWVYECPQCRREGRYDTVATTNTQMTAVEEWCVSDRVNGRKGGACTDECIGFPAGK